MNINFTNITINGNDNHIYGITDFIKSDVNIESINISFTDISMSTDNSYVYGII